MAEQFRKFTAEKTMPHYTPQKLGYQKVAPEKAMRHAAAQKAMKVSTPAEKNNAFGPKP